MIGAIAVTVPSCVYLLQPKPNKSHDHGHGDEHEEHEEQEEATKEEEAEPGSSDDGKSEEVPETASDKEESSSGQGTEKSDSDGEEQDSTPDTSDDEGEINVAHEKEGGGNVEGVQFKGATSGGTEEGEQGDTRKHIPDAKGANKKRIESDYGNRQGIDDEAFDREEDGTKSDKVCKITAVKGW